MAQKSIAEQLREIKELVRAMQPTTPIDTNLQSGALMLINKTLVDISDMWDKLEEFKKEIQGLSEP